MSKAFRRSRQEQTADITKLAGQAYSNEHTLVNYVHAGSALKHFWSYPCFMVALLITDISPVARLSTSSDSLIYFLNTPFLHLSLQPHV